MSVVGITLQDISEISVWGCMGLTVAGFVVLTGIAYFLLGRIYNRSISLVISNTPITITYGDIFSTSGYKVIACDTHFDTRVDDVVISKSSLHGKLVLQHGSDSAIRKLVEEEAKRIELDPVYDDLYDFPLGTIIKYNSEVDGQTYLMLAMTKLDKEYKAHTNMGQYEQMLMKMWHEIDRVYASNEVVLPILGTGISRFDDGPKNKDNLLRCMLCTFKNSGVSLNTTIRIVIYGDSDSISLYEYKSLINDTLW